MPTRLIAVGDIHGCAAALDGLLAAIRLTAADRIVFLGDYVDRGPDSCGVIQRIIELQQSFDVVPLLGNHEEMMLSVLEHRSPLSWWFMYGGRETMLSYGNELDVAVVPKEHLTFLKSLRSYHEEPEHFFVHANYVASETLDHQPPEALRWVGLRETIPGPHDNGKLAVVGHTSQKKGEVLDLGHLVCLDTYCFGGGWLTARDMLSGQTWQVNQFGEARPEKSS